MLYQHNSTAGGDFCHGTAAEIDELYVVSLEHAVGTNKRRNIYATEAVRRSSGWRAGCVLFFTVSHFTTVRRSGQSESLVFLFSAYE